PSSASCSLPSDTREYAADGTTVLRKTHTDYNLTATYINATRRLIGLPSAQYLYEGDGATLLSKVDYQYDIADAPPIYYLTPTASAPANHDPAYDDATSSRQGRGNLCI